MTFSLILWRPGPFHIGVNSLKEEFAQKLRRDLKIKMACCFPRKCIHSPTLRQVFSRRSYSLWASMGICLKPLHI